VVTAGPTTQLLTQRLIVDDDDTDIVYTGSWARNTDRYVSSTNPQEGLPYRKTTSQATSSGPTATFRFRGEHLSSLLILLFFITPRLEGTSVAVYSLFDYSRLGPLSVTYTMDGFPLSLSYNVGPSTPAYKQGAKTIENTLMFSNDSLASGDHTLVINITACTNQIFALDYILYSPSFNTISDKPNFGNGATTSTGSSSSSSPTGSSVSSTQTLPGSSESSPSHTQVSSSTGKKPPVGAIVGGVIGAIAALVAFFVILCRKRLINRYSSSAAAISRSCMFFLSFRFSHFRSC